MNICKENQIFMFDLEILVKYIYGTDIQKTAFVSFLIVFSRATFLLRNPV